MKRYPRTLVLLRQESSNLHICQQIKKFLFPSPQKTKKKPFQICTTDTTKCRIYGEDCPVKFLPVPFLFFIFFIFTFNSIDGVKKKKKGSMASHRNYAKCKNKTNTKPKIKLKRPQINTVLVSTCIYKDQSF